MCDFVDGIYQEVYEWGILDIPVLGNFLTGILYFWLGLFCFGG